MDDRQRLRSELKRLDKLTYLVEKQARELSEVDKELEIELQVIEGMCANLRKKAKVLIKKLPESAMNLGEMIAPLETYVVDHVATYPAQQTGYHQINWNNTDTTWVGGYPPVPPNGIIGNVPAFDEAELLPEDEAPEAEN